MCGCRRAATDGKKHHENEASTLARSLDVVAAAAFRSAKLLQAAEELQDRFLVLGWESSKIPGSFIRLAAMPQNRVPQSHTGPVMHQPAAKTQAPKGCGPDTVLRFLEILKRAFPRHLPRRAAVVFDGWNDNPISSSHVVEQEVAKRVKRLVANRSRYCIGAAVDPGTGGCSRH